MTKDLYLRKMKPLRKRLRENMTEAEVYLWSKIRKKQLGFTFRRQVSIGYYIVDFYCQPLNLAIEIDGPIHMNKQVKSRDNNRQKRIESDNIEFLRFNNEAVLKRIQDVLIKIKKRCVEIQNQTTNSPPKGESAEGGRGTNKE